MSSSPSALTGNAGHRRNEPRSCLQRLEIASISVGGHPGGDSSRARTEKHSSSSPSSSSSSLAESSPTLPIDSEPGGAGAAPVVGAVTALRPSAQPAPNPRDANASDRAPGAADSEVGSAPVRGSAEGGADCAVREDSSLRCPDACLAGCVDDSATSVLWRFGTGDSLMPSSQPCRDVPARHSACAERESSPTLAHALSVQDLSKHFPAVEPNLLLPCRAARSACAGPLSACGMGAGGIR